LARRLFSDVPHSELIHPACSMRCGATISGHVVIGIVIAVLDPLAGIAGHVVKTKPIRAEAPHGTCEGIVVIAIHKSGCGNSLGLGGEIGATGRGP
jgi:hypothetical protein